MRSQKHSSHFSYPRFSFSDKVKIFNNSDIFNPRKYMFQFKFENIKAFLCLVFFSKLFFDDPNIKGKISKQNIIWNRTVSS